MCPHYIEKLKTVDHMETQCERMLAHDYTRRHDELHLLKDLPQLWPYKKYKNKNHSVQTCITTKDVEITVDTRIQSAIKVKYNKPDI